jgi:FHS family Na+ dependent glucose MFS transporter 1
MASVNHTDDQRLSRTFGYYASFVALGMATAVLGPTLPGLAAQTGTQLSAISLLFTAHSLGYLIGSFQAGRLYDRAPGHPVMAAGLLTTAAMLAAIPLIPTLWLLSAAVLLLGAAEGTLDVGGNALLVWVHGPKVGPFMNGLHFFFGVGSFLTPLIVAQVLSVSAALGGAYWILAFLMLPVAAWLLRLRSPATPSTANDDPEHSSAATAANAASGKAERALVILIALFLFLYAGAEIAFGGWIYTYALARNLADATTAAVLTSVFWGSLTVGRFLSIPIALRFRPHTILLVDLVGCLLSVGVLLAWPHTWTATWLGACGLGLAMASVFPTAISWAERRLPITGRTTSWFFVGASLGGMFLPWAIGQFFEPVGPEVTMVIILIDLTVTLGVFAGLMLFSARRLSPAADFVYNRNRD